MSKCLFCQVVARGVAAAVAWESAALIVFADHRPIRPGHVQIVPKAHYEVFDDLPPDLAAQIVRLGQSVARAQKRLYGVTRVGFAFTGNDVAHCHAHVVPLFASDDITSARYADGTAVYIDHQHRMETAKALSRELNGGAI